MTDANNNENKNDLVVINLDRPRFLRFGHKALKRLTALTGRSLEKMDEVEFGLEDLEKVLWCGLQQDAIDNNEELTLGMMEDILDCSESYGDILESMNQALAKAFQKTEKEKN